MCDGTPPMAPSGHLSALPDELHVVSRDSALGALEATADRPWAPDQLEERYRQRKTLKVNILPDDSAQAVLPRARQHPIGRCGRDWSLCG